MRKDEDRKEQGHEFVKSKNIEVWFILGNNERKLLEGFRRRLSGPLLGFKTFSSHLWPWKDPKSISGYKALRKPTIS